MPMDVGHDMPEIFGIRDIDFPEIRGYEVGAIKYIVAKVEVTSKSSQQLDAGRTIITGNLKIKSIRALGTETKTVEQYENEEFGKAKAEALYGSSS